MAFWRRQNCRDCKQPDDYQGPEGEAGCKGSGRKPFWVTALSHSLTVFVVTHLYASVKPTELHTRKGEVYCL